MVKAYTYTIRQIMKIVYTIAIIGSGVIGGATGTGFASLGNIVIFIDNNPDTLARLTRNGHTTSSINELPQHNPNIIFMCLPIPTTYKGVDLSALENTLCSVAEYLATTETDYPIIVLRSTAPIGTTHSAIRLLEKYSGKKCGQNFGVCVNPEYLRERYAEDDFLNPHVVIIGSEDTKATKRLTELYITITDNIAVIGIREAEQHKYIHNLYNACKISFFNEHRYVCNVLGIDADTVFPLVVESSEASWNPIYGTKDMGAFCGSCLPKDTKGFLKFAKQHALSMPLLEAIIVVNERTKSV